MTSNAKKTELSSIKALVFDVFGTVVDWRGSVIPQVESVAARHGIIDRDWGSFTNRWRQGYSDACRALSRGEGEWQLVDEIHRHRLDELLEEFGMSGAMPEREKSELNHAWHRLDAWPDSVAGLQRIRSKFIISTLSNGNLALLVNMARYAGLTWDAILSADVVNAYKPSPAVYKSAVRLLGRRPEEVMMVAAHEGDLVAAEAEGLATAFVHRPFEYGSQSPAEMPLNVHRFDAVANDFLHLADQLGCDQ